MDNETSQKVTAKQKITRLLAIFGVYFAIPIIAYFMAKKVQVHEYEFKFLLGISNIHRTMKTDSPKEFPSLKETCEESGKDYLEKLSKHEFAIRKGVDPGFDVMDLDESVEYAKKINLKGLCSSYNRATLVKNASLASGGMTLVLLIGIAISGWIARANRFLLLFLFRPGLIITLLSVIILLILNTTLAIASILYAGIFSKFDNSGGFFLYSVIVSIGIGFIALLIILPTIATSIGILKIQGISTVGKPLEKDRYAALWGEIEWVAKQVGTSVPDHVTAGLRPEFFVEEEEVESTDGNLTGRTMYISLPFLRILSKEEMRGIVGHELAHFKGLDTRFSRKFNPFYRRAVDSYYAMTGGSEQKGWFFGLFPAVLIFSFFMWSYEVAAAKLSRERELIADAVGAEVSGRKSKASGLVKHVAFIPIYKAVMKSVYDSLAEGKRLDNVGAMFEEYANRHAVESILDGIDQEVAPHPMDYHPPLRIRLEALGLSVDDVRNDALKLSHESNWIHLIDDFEGLEKELSDASQNMLLESGSVEIYKKEKEEEQADSSESQPENKEV